MNRQSHVNFINKIYNINEETTAEDIFEVIIKIHIPKSEESGAHALVTSTMTDIRSITRVTTVSSVQSRIVNDMKEINVKIKFNAKNLNQEGIKNPEHFVHSILIPTVQKLDTYPRVISISPVKSTIKRK